MRFCLNNAVYLVESLDKVAEALGLEGEDLETVLSVVYVTTKKALAQNMDALMNIGIHTGELEREQGDILAETSGFREFMTAIEASYPTVLLKAHQVMEDVRQGRLLIDGGSIVVLLEN